MLLRILTHCLYFGGIGHKKANPHFKQNTVMGNTVTLESLLATHDHPFVVVDRSLKIVAVNQSYERRFSVSAKDLVGSPCCSAFGQADSSHSRHCRHQRFFREVEPFAEIRLADIPQSESTSVRVRGYPLVDGDGVIYLGESVAATAPENNESIDTQMVGGSIVFSDMMTQLKQASATEAPVMLTGETGTGKELAAEYIHANSNRRDKEFVIVDCTVLGENLFESELFGHDKGAFTGASTVKKGLFQVADGGTLFLDEIGELPISQQPKLLRALESGTFRRVGGTQTQRSDVRVICATNRNLPECVKSEQFREDLYYRLSVFPIRLPPLRERVEDIPAIAEKVLSAFGDSNGGAVQLSNGALQRLQQYTFPGNIRELRNTLQLASALCHAGLIEADDIHLRGENEVGDLPTNAARNHLLVASNNSSHGPLENMEAGYIRSLLEKHQGNRRKIAFEMNVSERTLYRKLKRFNLNQNKSAAGWA